MIDQYSSKKPQKIIIGCLYILILIVGFFDLFSASSHFTPTDRVAQFGFYFSIIIAYSVVLLSYYLAYHSQWKMPKSLTQQISGPIQHIFNFICLAPLFAALLYYTFSGIAPYLYTYYFGHQTEKQVIATAVISKSNKTKCSYELKSKSLNYFFFNYCLTTQQYKQFPPKQSVMVKLSTQQSYLGTIVDSLQGIIPESTNQP
ncbi:hypothetical protein NDN11_02225 [Acinetobacter sp. C26M]|uniref:hypothetical protein n=1 Tax=unclassified Acinetobacter TaxID=196816 RepID=UPI00203744D3|nr:MULTISPECIES: hypothetical protein [unclassified Acinetobacter]USA46980.1 hypothetical protein NDN11_02225 [Acinetobacter sp. C26M]USA50461.1 hypothetical protein NDN12_02225 [Acinetobacter sp. C26G]